MPESSSVPPPRSPAVGGAAPSPSSSGLAAAAPFADPPPRTYWDIALAAFTANRPAVWALAVVFGLFAVAGLAPFLANSRPYALRDANGQLAFPLLAGLTLSEKLVLVCEIYAALALTVLWLGRRYRLTAHDARPSMALSGWWAAACRAMANSWRPVGLVAAGFGITLTLAVTTHQPSEDKTEYRRLAAEGQFAWAVFAPVPFAYDDTDIHRIRRSPSWGVAYKLDDEAFQSFVRRQVPPAVADAVRPLAGRRFSSLAELQAAAEPLWPPAATAQHRFAFEQAASTDSHWLGTDDTGGDITARLIYGSRTSLAVGFVSVGISVLIGVTIGAIVGYIGGWLDLLTMRAMEIIMAIPTFLLILTITAFFPRPISAPPEYDLFKIMIVIGLTTWPTQARFVRAEFLKLRQQDFVIAAEALGASSRTVMFRHMLPSGIAPTLVEATFGVGAAIFIESALSFLGVGVSADVPSWGAMLKPVREHPEAWWLSVFPGLAIFITVLAYNLVGEGLRDAVDPRLRKSAT